MSMQQQSRAKERVHIPPPSMAEEGITHFGLEGLAQGDYMFALNTTLGTLCLIAGVEY